MFENIDHSTGDFTHTICTYQEYIVEAVVALSHSLKVYEKYNASTYKYSLISELGIAELSCRYAFLMIANSLEASANGLLLSLKLSTSLHEELEKLGTLIKYELFCQLKGKNLPRDNSSYKYVKEIIKCRNEFVHPKPEKIGIQETLAPNFGFSIDIKTTKERKYPLHLGTLKPLHSLQALQDVLKFTAWVTIDICNMTSDRASCDIGFGSFSISPDLIDLERQSNVVFDKRTLGINESIDL